MKIWPVRWLLNLDKCCLAAINAKIEPEAFELIDVNVEIGCNVPLFDRINIFE